MNPGKTIVVSGGTTLFITVDRCMAVSVGMENFELWGIGFLIRSHMVVISADQRPLVALTI